MVGYRKNVVKSNLELAFPKKSKKEIHQIQKKFYHHFCDMFLEMVKTMSISGTALKKRFVVKNPEELERLQSLDKSHIILLGHYASYEWVNALHFYGLTYEAYGVYKKIKNRYFDCLIKRIRSKHHTTMLATKDVPKQILRNKKDQLLSSYGMIADQTPKRANYKFWTDFMGVKVPFFTGSEKLAKDFDMPVYYLEVEKVKRGFYEARLKKITNNPQSEPDFFITTSFRDRLEAQIKAHPEYYLWTHKRFKHRNAPIPENAVVR